MNWAPRPNEQCLTRKAKHGVRAKRTRMPQSLQRSVPSIVIAQLGVPAHGLGALQGFIVDTGVTRGQLGG